MRNIVSNLYADYLRYIDRFRAIPWETDMLKPVERRTLLTVHEVAKGKFVKSAKVVGSVLGNYHPHGEASCVDVLVGMVQNGWVEGQGNWGTDKAKDYIKAASSRYTECKALKFLDDGFSEFLDFVPWEEFEYANEPHFLPFYLPIGLIGEGLIQGISLHTTKIPRYKFEDLLTRLYELITDSDTKTIIIPNIENNDIFEDQPGELEKILSTGEGIVYAIPKYKVINNCIYVYGKSPISKFNKLDAFNEKYDKDNGKEFATIIDSSDTKLEIIISPKKGNCDKKFVETIMDLVISKIHVKCNVVVADGTVLQKGIDEILLNCFNKWKTAYLAKITKDLNLLNTKLDEFNIILVIRGILTANPNVKLIKDICNLNTSQYSNDEIERVCSKHRIKTLIEAHVDIPALQKTIVDTQNEIQNIDIFTIKRIETLLGK